MYQFYLTYFDSFDTIDTRYNQSIDNTSRAEKEESMGQTPGCTLQISLTAVGEILRIGDDYRLPDLYLGIPPTRDELQARATQGLGGLTLVIENDGAEDDNRCYFSLLLPDRDPSRQPATVTTWGWQTLAYFSIPIALTDHLIAALQMIQRMR
jgi:hypothetical protein